MDVIVGILLFPILLDETLQGSYVVGRTAIASRKNRNLSRVCSVIATLLLMRPHFLASDLLLVVHRTCAVRPVYAMLLVVYLGSVVGGVRVRIGVVVLLLPVHTVVG